MAQQGIVRLGIVRPGIALKPAIGRN
ncbi:MAG: hypothetical protein JWP04_3645, partial [Belnapia sp.]|nr:hypothetical protein [Belnapia sp.]